PSCLAAYQGAAAMTTDAKPAGMAMSTAPSSTSPQARRAIPETPSARPVRTRIPRAASRIGSGMNRLRGPGAPGTARTLMLIIGSRGGGIHGWPSAHAGFQASGFRVQTEQPYNP